MTVRIFELIYRYSISGGPWSDPVQDNVYTQGDIESAKHHLIATNLGLGKKFDLIAGRLVAEASIGGLIQCVQ
jgi:hypothetical protein